RRAEDGKERRRLPSPTLEPRGARASDMECEHVTSRTIEDERERLRRPQSRRHFSTLRRGSDVTSRLDQHAVEVDFDRGELEQPQIDRLADETLIDIELDPCPCLSLRPALRNL